MVAIADTDAARSAHFAQQYGCVAYTDHTDLLAKEEIDLVLAGVPHALHAPIVLDALNAGKHVLVECDALLETAQRKGVQLMVGHTQHFFKTNLITKDLIDRGAIGALILATQVWYKPFGLADGVNNARSERRLRALSINLCPPEDRAPRFAFA